MVSGWPIAAIGELLVLRQQWQQEYRNPLFNVPQPTLNLGCIHGGDNPNRICGQCSLEFDLRPLPGMDPEVLRTTRVRWRGATTNVRANADHGRRACRRGVLRHGTDRA